MRVAGRGGGGDSSGWRLPGIQDVQAQGSLGFRKSQGRAVEGLTVIIGWYPLPAPA